MSQTLPLFSVSQECRALGLRAGAVVFRDLTIEREQPLLREAIRAQASADREAFAEAQLVRALPEVLAFQDILRRVGVNPRREQPSVERLLTSILKRGDLPAINSLVDAYNLVSIRSRCSLGAHDLDRIRLPVELRMLTGRETFTPLGSESPLTLPPTEFAYVDADQRVLCRLDILQAEFSKVTTATRNALLIVEATAAHAPVAIQGAFDDAVALITRYCGGTAEVVARPDQS